MVNVKSKEQAIQAQSVYSHLGEPLENWEHDQPVLVVVSRLNPINHDLRGIKLDFEG